MQQIPADVKQAPRFLHLLIQEDLLGGWSLVREMGYQGKSGRIRRNHFTDYDSVIQAMLKERDTQITRGYKVVFVEGQHHEQ